jgi:hypothetical protein
MPQIPRWRLEPEPVWISCKSVKKLPQFKEVIVQFDANGEEFTSFVPEKFVNVEKKWLWGVIIAEFDGGILVDIPAETFTSGPRIAVMDSEKDSVLVSAKHDS